MRRPLPDVPRPLHGSASAIVPMDWRLAESHPTGSQSPPHNVLPVAPSFRTRAIARMVFQFRVVAGTPKIFSIWPR